MNITRVRTQVPIVEIRGRDLSHLLPVYCTASLRRGLCLYLGTHNRTALHTSGYVFTTYGCSMPVTETFWGDAE